MSAERKMVTVLFADLVGFTPLSERLDPEDVAAIQQGYFAAARLIAKQFDGLLEKFMGDAAMLEFGIPRARDDDAERAVRAGLSLVNAVDQLRAQLGADAETLQVRVGINSGEVLYAEMGPDQWSVTGDVVNVASRLQTAAPPGAVVVAESTALAVAEAVDVEPVGPLELKGKKAPIHAYRALGVRPIRSREKALGALRVPMVGRASELALLRDALFTANAGGAARLLIVAPPGIGKTRLVEELAALAERELAPAPLIWRARLRAEVTSPFEPIGQLVAAALASAGVHLQAAPSEALASQVAKLMRERLHDWGWSETRSEAVIGQLLAVIWPGTSHAGSEPKGPVVAADQRQALFNVWLEGLDALAGEATVLWIIEDLHWAGGDMLAFLDASGSRSGRGGRLILATARPSLLERDPVWAADQEGSGVLHLPPLPPADTEALVHALVGNALPGELAQRVAERSDGNPLFIEEILRMWIASGALVLHEGAWHLSAAAGEVPVPPTVQAVYAAQLDELPPNARDVARRAAVAGRRFPRQALEALEVTHAAEGVATLRRRALVAGPFADPLLGETYAYRHALLWEAGYASLARSDRARLHVRLARWLEMVAGRQSAEIAEVIGGHYAAALRAVPALSRVVAEELTRADAAAIAASWFERAAEVALKVAAHDATRALLRQALDLTPEGSVLDRARRLERLGEALAVAADVEDAAQTLQQAINLYRRRLRDWRIAPEEAALARSGYARAAALLGWTWHQQFRFDEAQQLANDAMQEVGAGQTEEAARLLAVRAISTLYSTDTTAAPQADAEHAVRLARAARNRPLELHALQVLASVRTEAGLATPSEWAEVERMARREGRWIGMSEALYFQALLLLDDHAADALGPIQRSAEIADVHGLSESLVWTHYLQAEAGLVSGDWDRALSAGLRGISLGERNAYQRTVSRIWFVLLPIAVARRADDIIARAFDWWQRRRAHFPRPPSPYGQLMLAAVDLHFAEAGLLPPFVPEVASCLAAFDLDHRVPSWLAAVETIIRCWLATEDFNGVGEAILKMRRRVIHPNASSLSRGTELLLRTELLIAEGASPKDAVPAARRAVARFRRSRAPWWVVRTIRLLESRGWATPTDLQEARGLERLLQLAPGPP